MDEIIAESVNDVARRGLADLGHYGEQRHVVFEDGGVGVGREIPLVGRLAGIGRGLVALAAVPRCHAVAAGGRASVGNDRELDDVAALGDRILRAKAAGDERLAAPGRRDAQRRQVRCVETIAAGQRVRELGAVDRAHRRERRRRAGRLFGEQEARKRGAGEHSDDAAHEQ